MLDIGLPIMDGYQLALAMRARLGDAPLTLIALSGYGQERDRERSRLHGFAAHLVKPTEVPEFLKLIERAGSLDLGGDTPGVRATSAGTTLIAATPSDA